jgi:hypothetical protein
MLSPFGKGTCKKWSCLLSPPLGSANTDVGNYTHISHVKFTLSFIDTKNGDAPKNKLVCFLKNQVFFCLIPPTVSEKEKEIF